MIPLTFHSFLKLPKELQIQIWKYNIDEAEHFDWLKYPPTYSKHRLSLLRPRALFGPNDNDALYINRPYLDGHKVLFQIRGICKTSRQLVLEEWKRQLEFIVGREWRFGDNPELNWQIHGGVHKTSDYEGGLKIIGELLEQVREP